MLNRKQSLRDQSWSGAPKTRSKLTGEHLTQKRDSDKAAAVHLYYNHTAALVLPRRLAVNTARNLLKLNTSDGLLPMNLQHIHRKYYYEKPTTYITQPSREEATPPLPPFTHTHTHTHTHFLSTFLFQKEKREKRVSKQNFSHCRASRIQSFFVSANHDGQQYFSLFHGPVLWNPFAFTDPVFGEWRVQNRTNFNAVFPNECVD